MYVHLILQGCFPLLVVFYKLTVKMKKIHVALVQIESRNAEQFDVLWSEVQRIPSVDVDIIK